MAVQTPPTPARVSEELRRWLRERFGGGVDDREEPARVSGGFDFWIYLLRVSGDRLPAEWTLPLVARMPPTPERFELLERESRLQGWSANHHYPAPRVLGVLGPGELFDSPVQIVERMPGATMATVMTSQPWRIPGLVRRLAALQADLHALAVPDWAQNEPGWSLADRRLGLVRYVTASISHPELAAGLDRLDRTLPLLDVADPVICHGDFHPMNVLVTDDNASVIDWTDAGIGDRHGDIARTAWLFRFASVAAPTRVERAVLRSTAPVLANRYLTAYRRHRPVDPARLRLWMSLHLLHVWAMAVADEVELFGPSRAGHDFRPGLAPWAREHFLDATKASP